MYIDDHSREGIRAQRAADLYIYMYIYIYINIYIYIYI